MNTISYKLPFLLLLCIFLLSSCSCGGNDEDDDAAAPDNDDVDDDSGNIIDDSADDDLDDDTELPFCYDGFRFGDSCIRQLGAGSPGLNGTGVVVGPDGVIAAVAASGRNIYLYTKTETQTDWEKTLIARMGSDPDIAVDADGYYHIAFTNLWDETVDYATNISGEWQTEHAASLGVIGSDWLNSRYSADAAIAVAEGGDVFISYYNAGIFCVQVAHRQDGAWSSDTIALVGIYGIIVTTTDIALGADQAPRIVWDVVTDMGGAAVYYAAKSETGWNKTALSSIGYMPSLAVDSDGVDHVAFSKLMSLQLDFGIVHASNPGGVWAYETVEYVSGHTLMLPSVTIAADNTIHVVYWGDIDWPTVAVRHAWLESGTWNTEDIYNPSYDADFIASAVDADGNLFAVINDFDRDLILAQKSSGAWGTTTIDEGSSGNPKLAMKRDGSVVGVFTTEEGIWFLDSDQTRELAVPAQPDGKTGRLIGIFTDSNDNVHFAYVREQEILSGTYSHTYHMMNTAGVWSTEEIDLNGIVTSDFHLDVNDNLHLLVSLEDGLGYATNADGDWRVETVDPEADSNRSLAIDANGSAHISFQQFIRTTDRNYYIMAYATNAGGAWVIKHPDLEEDCGYGNSIAVDDSGAVHISHTNRYEEYIKYSTNAGGVWHNMQIPDWNNIRESTTIIIDPYGQPVILTSSYDSELLMFSYDGENWQSRILDHYYALMGNSATYDDSRRIHVGYYGNSAGFYGIFSLD